MHAISRTSLTTELKSVNVLYINKTIPTAVVEEKQTRNCTISRISTCSVWNFSQIIEKSIDLIKFLVVFRSTFHVADRLWDVPETKIQKVWLFTEHTQLGAC